MVRVKGKDDLKELNGALANGFRRAALVSLEKAIVKKGPEATRILAQFLLAAEKLGSYEKSFNQRARPTTETGPDHMAHLRTEEHFMALRGFATAKRHLLKAEPKLGHSLSRIVERNFDERETQKPASPKARLTKTL